MRDGWTMTPISALARRRTDFTEVDLASEYSIVGVQRSGWGFVVRDPIRGDQQKFKKLLRLRKGNLVYRTITAFEAPAAVAGEAEHGLFVTPQTFPVFELETSVLMPEYMRLVTTWPRFHEEMSKRCTGTVLRRKTLSIGAFSSINVPLPPLAEQRRIVDLIAAVDDAIEAATAYAGGARTSRASLLTRVLGGKHWPTSELGAIATVNRGVSWKKNQETPTPSESSVPVVRIGNVQINGIDMSETLYIDAVKQRDLERKSLLDTTILMVGSNGNPKRVGNAFMAGPALVGHLYASFLIGIEAADELLPEFLWFWIQSEETQRAITEATAGSTGLKNISLRWLRELPVPVPAKSEQQRVVDLISSVDQAVRRGDAMSAGLRKLRSEMLTLLLSGEHEIPGSYDVLLEEVAS